MQRTTQREWMDDPAVGVAELGSSLRYIRRVNRHLGGSNALVRHLRGWSVAWPGGGGGARDGSRRPVTILDVGTGAADIPLTVCAWARAEGLKVRVTAIDVHERTLEVARAATEEEPDVEIVACDARHIADRFGAESFDYVHAGMFLHHLPDIEVATVLAAMHRLARAGVVWNDLVRSRVWRVLAGVTLIGQAPIVRHDAIVSIERGFTRAEVLDTARRVGIDYAAYHAEPWGYRFTLAGEKPGAWNGSGRVRVRGEGQVADEGV